MVVLLIVSIVIGHAFRVWCHWRFVIWTIGRCSECVEWGGETASGQSVLECFGWVTPAMGGMWPV